MDNSQEPTTPLSRFFTFWWILAGFAAFGLLALAAFALSGAGKKDAAYEDASAKRLITKSEVMVAQAKQLTEVGLDLQAGALALGRKAVAASKTVVPGTPTHDKWLADMNAKAEADAAANASGDEQTLTITATNSAKGEPPLQFVEKELTAVAGMPVALTFINPDVQMHNFVLCKPGKLEAVAALATAMATDPQGMAKGYIPETDDILAHTKLLTIGQRETIKFTAPGEPGDYPYVCTFPGHYILMRGVLKVTPAPAATDKPAAATAAAEQILTITATNSAKGEPPLQYVEKELTAVAGKPVALTLINPDVQMHNFVLCKPGKLEAVAALATAMATDPQGMAKGYIPESEDILAHTKLLTIGQRETIKFTAPAEPGDYPYVCTFPGHYILMRGVLKITAP